MWQLLATTDGSLSLCPCLPRKSEISLLQPPAAACPWPQSPQVVGSQMMLEFASNTNRPCHSSGPMASLSTTGASSSSPPMFTFQAAGSLSPQVSDFPSRLSLGYCHTRSAALASIRAFTAGVTVPSNMKVATATLIQTMHHPRFLPTHVVR